MNIGIIGINKISKFYAVILSQYGHNIIMYENESPINNLAVEKFILEKSFYDTYIKTLPIFKSLSTESIHIEVTEKLFFKENKVLENFIHIKNYEYIDEFNFEKIPNVEIVQLNSESINHIKMREDILIVDTPDKNLLQQMNLIKLNHWTSLYLQAETPHNTMGFQITKQGKYSIFGLMNNDYMEVFVNAKQRNKKEVINLLSKKFKDIKLLDEQEIQKYDNYSYKNIAIINTALVECNYPYRDYSLLIQIIQNTDSKKIFSNLDIYSDIKSQVI